MPRKNSLYNISDEDFAKYVKNNSTYTDVYKACGMSPGGSNNNIKNRIEKLGLDKSHFTHYKLPVKIKKKIEEICVNNSSYNTNRLKKRLFSELNWEKKCAECGIGDTYNNEPLTLQLDHINGNNKDHRLENLRILCPNCHSQTDTYGGKNVKYIKNKCVDCNTHIHSQSTRCNSCAKKELYKTKRASWPSYEQLQKDFKELVHCTKVAKKYGVSSHTIKSWMKKLSKK
tara:strand:- start:5623 stop:6309 length:687 start_codon:yes stop_codon:yes gene_type:complete